MKALRYIYWFFCLACSAVIFASLLLFVVWQTAYDLYERNGFWGVMGMIAVIVVIVFGAYPISHWNYRPWKKEDRQP